MIVFNAILPDQDELNLQPVSVLASVPDGDQLGAIVIDALRSLDAMDVTVQEGSANQAQHSAEDATTDLGVVIPDGFTSDIRAGRSSVVRVIEGDSSGLESDIVISVIRSVTDQMYAGALTARAGAAAGVEPERLAEVARQAATGGPELSLSEGVAADEQLSGAGSLVAGQAGLFLLFTVGFGVLALLAEREQGTLARLQSMPMRRGLIVGAKVLSGYVLGVVATGVLLLAGTLLFDVSFGNPFTVGVLVLAAVAAATSLTFVVARIARSAEQANVSQAIVAMSLGVAGGAFFPIQVTGFAGTLLEFNPVAGLQRGLGITSGGGGITDIATPVLTMIAFAVVFTLLSRLVPDRGGAQ